METINITVLGNVPTKKNHSRIIRAGHRIMLVPSKQYKAFEEKCVHFLKPKHINQPVNVKCVFYMKARYKVDLPNLLNSILDILVKYKVLEDDCRDIVFSTDGSKVLYDKTNPRVEIEIKPLQGVEVWKKEVKGGKKDRSK